MLSGFRGFPVGDQFACQNSRCRSVRPIKDMLVQRSELDGSMNSGSRRTAHKEGSVHSQLFHVFAKKLHLVKRRGDQSADTDNVRPNPGGFLKNGLFRDHDPEVRDLETVAGEHYSGNILPYVMDISFHGGQQYLGPFGCLG